MAVFRGCMALECLDLLHLDGLVTLWIEVAEHGAIRVGARAGLSCYMFGSRVYCCLCKDGGCAYVVLVSLVVYPSPLCKHPASITLTFAILNPVQAPCWASPIQLAPCLACSVSLQPATCWMPPTAGPWPCSTPRQCASCLGQ